MVSSILAKFSGNERQGLLTLIARKFSASTDKLAFEIESFRAKSPSGFIHRGIGC